MSGTERNIISKMKWKYGKKKVKSESRSGSGQCVY